MPEKKQLVGKGRLCFGSELGSYVSMNYVFRGGMAEDRSRAVKSLKLECYTFSHPGRTESREGEMLAGIRIFHFPCFIHSES